MTPSDKLALTNAVARSAVHDMDWVLLVLDDSPHPDKAIHDNVREHLGKLYNAFAALRRLTDQD